MSPIYHDVVTSFLGSLCSLESVLITPSVAQAGLKFRDPSASASRELGLKACDTAAGWLFSLNIVTGGDIGTSEPEKWNILRTLSGYVNLSL